MKWNLSKSLIPDSWKPIGWVLTVAAIVLFIRKTDALLNPQFWAEDGSVFFLEQYEAGGSALFKPYAGYLLLVPRLVALFTDVFFPYSVAPFVYNFSSFLLTLLVVASVFSPRFKVRYKPLFALAIVLVPLYANEVFLNITNIQWILAILLVIVLMKEKPDSKYGDIKIQTALDLITIILCGLTGPFMLFLLPFFTWNGLRNRSLYHRSILFVAIVVSLIQLFFILSDPERFRDGNLILGLLAYSKVVGYRVFGLLFLGIHAPQDISYGFFFIYLILVLIMFRFALLKGDFLVISCLGIQLLILLATFFRFRDNPDVLFSAENGSRYFYVPYVLLTWSLIAWLEKQEKWKNLLVQMGLTLILVSSLTSRFHSPPLTDYNWEKYSRSIGKEDVVIPINPKGWEIHMKAHPE